MWIVTLTQVIENMPRSPEPFKIDPDTLYSMDWLRERLRGIVELPTLLDRTKLRSRRKFRDAILGSELLEALQRVEPYSSDAVDAPAPMQTSLMRPTSCRGNQKASSPTARLSPADVK